MKLTNNKNKGNKVNTNGSIKAEIKGNTLYLELPVNPQPVSSASGKTLVVASSHGNIATTAIVNGKPVTVGVNAYIRR